MIFRDGLNLFPVAQVRLRIACTLFLLLVTVPSVEAVAGIIKGHVRERKTNSPIPGATVFIEGKSFGAVTDTHGEYSIDDAPRGNYRVAAHVIGYVSIDTLVEVKNDSSVVVEDFYLSEKPIRLKETIIEARANDALEVSARATEKNSGNIVNVISAQAIEESTDRTAADVLQRVSGMSLIRSEGEGRYVVMRGTRAAVQQYSP